MEKEISRLMTCRAEKSVKVIWDGMNTLQVKRNDLDSENIAGGSLAPAVDPVTFQCPDCPAVVGCRLKVTEPFSHEVFVKVSNTLPNSIALKFTRQRMFSSLALVADIQ
jgi:hypothetical protein